MGIFSPSEAEQHFKKHYVFIMLKTRIKVPESKALDIKRYVRSEGNTRRQGLRNNTKQGSVIKRQI
jgi:hypothetical protein